MVEKIYKEFEKKRADVLKQPEFKEKELTPEREKEILKQAVSENIQTIQPISDDQQQATSQTAKQIKEEPKERQVKLLIDLAFEKDLSHAVEVARRLDNPYLLDEFHDVIVDELYNKLVEEGKLKKL